MLRERPHPSVGGIVALLVVSLIAVGAGATPLAPAAAQSSYTFTLTPSATATQAGSAVYFTGTVCPSPNAPLGLGANITYTAPNGTRSVRSETLGYGSSWCSPPFAIDTFVPNSSGTWTAVSWVHWAEGGTGPNSYVESNTVTIQVSGSTTTTTSTSSLSTTTSTTTTVPPPGSQCDASSPGNSSVVSLAPDCYNYQTLSISSDALAVYYSKSTAPVDTGIMTGAQLASFEQTGDFAGTMGAYGSYQTGTSNLNALLLTAGTYYLVVSTGSSPAEVNYTNVVNTDLPVHNDTTSVGSFLTIPPSSSFGVAVHDETSGSPSTISLFGISNVTLQYALLDVNSNSYVPPLTPSASPAVTVTNLTESANGPVIGYNLSLPISTYVVKLSNPNPVPAFAFFSYQIQPEYVYPFLVYGNESQPAPTGLASYGVTPQGSGPPSTYFVTSNTVIGFANITSFHASEGGCQGQSSIDATFQLNSVLVVTHPDSPPGVYWPQNVPYFATGCSAWVFTNNVLNVTGDGAYLTNSSITGYGSVLACPPSVCATPQEYYGVAYGPGAPASTAYRLPLAFTIYMNASVVSGEGVLLTMGYQVLQNGTTVANPRTVVFDRIMVHDPLAQDAFFYVTGVAYTPVGALLSFQHGSFYDTEAVFGGPGNGASADFKQLSADVGLFYVNGTGQPAPFPSYFSFGGDTGETVSDVHVTYLGQGVAALSVGSPNYEYLSPPSGAGTTTTPGAAPASAPFPYVYLAIALVAVAAAAGGALFIRGRGARGAPPPPPP
ncbi:MAG: thermopsin family protease [Nitrososphaerota archaeon]|nr:thermopsin family protease [Nitrososphaerota archaeon]